MTDDNKTAPAFPEARTQQKTKRRALFLLGVFGFLGLIFANMLVGGVLTYSDERAGRTFADGLGVRGLLLMCIIACAGSMWWTLKFWRSIDEMARRAHLDAFYWGGPFAWCFVIPFGIIPLKFETWKLAPIEAIATSSTQAFAMGICAAVGATLIGYTIFWLFWWAKRR